MRFNFILHVDFEGPGEIGTWVMENGHELSTTYVYRRESWPTLDSFDCLVIMGGPMGAYEEKEFPWLVQEKRFIAEAIDADKLVLGVCLGSQLLADVLGAKVYPGHEKEIGWFPVELTSAASQSETFKHLPRVIHPLHWHGDTFDLPKKAIRLASSAAYENQAFQFGNKVIGIQFHLELTHKDAAEFIQSCGDKFPTGKFVQTPEELLAEEGRFADLRLLLNNFMNALSRSV